jgi:hypothetical protein
VKAALVELRIADVVSRRFGNRDLIERVSAGARLARDGIWVCSVPDLLVQEILDVQSAAALPSF